jgi:hypothetical protein
MIPVCERVTLMMTVRAQMQSSVPERSRVIPVHDRARTDAVVGTRARTGNTGARTHDVRTWVFVWMHPFTHG